MSEPVQEGGRERELQEYADKLAEALEDRKQAQMSVVKDVLARTDKLLKAYARDLDKRMRAVDLLTRFEDNPHVEKPRVSGQMLERLRTRLIKQLTLSEKARIGHGSDRKERDLIEGLQRHLQEVNSFLDERLEALEQVEVLCLKLSLHSSLRSISAEQREVLEDDMRHGLQNARMLAIEEERLYPIQKSFDAIRQKDKRLFQQAIDEARGYVAITKSLKRRVPNLPAETNGEPGEYDVMETNEEPRKRPDPIKIRNASLKAHEAQKLKADVKSRAGVDSRPFRASESPPPPPAERKGHHKMDSRSSSKNSIHSRNESEQRTFLPAKEVRGMLDAYTEQKRNSLRLNKSTSSDNVRRGKRRSRSSKARRPSSKIDTTSSNSSSSASFSWSKIPSSASFNGGVRRRSSRKTDTVRSDNTKPRRRRDTSQDKKADTPTTFADLMKLSQAKKQTTKDRKRYSTHDGPVQSNNANNKRTTPKRGKVFVPRVAMLGSNPTTPQRKPRDHSKDWSPKHSRDQVRAHRSRSQPRLPKAKKVLSTRRKRSRNGKKHIIRQRSAGDVDDIDEEQAAARLKELDELEARRLEHDSSGLSDFSLPDSPKSSSISKSRFEQPAKSHLSMQSEKPLPLQKKLIAEPKPRHRRSSSLPNIYSTSGEQDVIVYKLAMEVANLGYKIPSLEDRVPDVAKEPPVHLEHELSAQRQTRDAIHITTQEATYMLSALHINMTSISNFKDLINRPPMDSPIIQGQITSHSLKTMKRKIEDVLSMAIMNGLAIDVDVNDPNISSRSKQDHHELSHLREILSELEVHLKIRARLLKEVEDVLKDYAHYPFSLAYKRQAPEAQQIANDGLADDELFVMNNRITATLKNCRLAGINESDLAQLQQLYDSLAIFVEKRKELYGEVDHIASMLTQIDADHIHMQFAVVNLDRNDEKSMEPVSDNCLDLHVHSDDEWLQTTYRHAIETFNLAKRLLLPSQEFEKLKGDLELLNAFIILRHENRKFVESVMLEANPSTDQVRRALERARQADLAVAKEDTRTSTLSQSLHDRAISLSVTQKPENIEERKLKIRKPSPKHKAKNNVPHTLRSKLEELDKRLTQMVPETHQQLAVAIRSKDTAALEEAIRTSKRLEERLEKLRTLRKLKLR